MTKRLKSSPARIRLNPSAVEAAITAVGKSCEGLAAQAGVSLATINRARLGKPILRATASCVARALGRRLAAIVADEPVETVDAA